MLGPLLRSVAENVEELGFPEALTGPVRRGDAAAIERQIGLLRERLEAALPLFVASAWAQLPLARAIGDAPPEAFDAMASVLTKAMKVRAKSRAKAPRRASAGKHDRDDRERH
jgi:predicted short-subunit dehydrogenase-like oxidoreductase (DUF2520 family)